MSVVPFSRPIFGTPTPVLFSDLGRAPLERRILTLLDAGRWENALAADGIDPRDLRGRSVLMTLRSLDDCLGALPAWMRHATTALWLSVELPRVHLWDVAEALLASLLLQSGWHFAAIADFWAKVRGLGPKGSLPLPGADWDTDVVWVGTASSEDALLSWYVDRLTKLPLRLSAMLVRTMPQSLYPSDDAYGPCGAGEMAQIASTGLYREAPLATYLDALTIADVREEISRRGLDLRARKKADLLEGLARALSRDELAALLRSCRVAARYETVLDAKQSAHIRSLGGAARAEASQALGMLSSVRESIEAVEESVAYGVSAYLRPGPDRDCPFCPREPILLENGRRVAMPPYHGGCRCRVKVDYSEGRECSIGRHGAPLGR